MKKHFTFILPIWKYKTTCDIGHAVNRTECSTCNIKVTQLLQISKNCRNYHSRTEIDYTQLSPHISDKLN